MSEIVTFAAVGGAIIAGVGFGTRYINDLFRMEQVTVSTDQPIVRPFHPSGQDWKESEKT